MKTMVSSTSALMLAMDIVAENLDSDFNL